MADSDKILKLLIEVGVIGQDDAKAANDLLEQTKKGTENLAHATDAAASSNRLFAGEGRETHRIIGEINKILPGTAGLFREAFNPTALGAVGILVGLLYEAKQALDEYNKSLDAEGAAAAKPAFDAVQNIQTAWDDARKKFGEYQSAVDSAGKGKDKDPVDEQIKREKEMTDAKLAGIRKIIEELGREEVARLRAEHASPEAIAAAEQRTQDQVAGVDANKKGADATRASEEYAKRNAPGNQMALDAKAKATAEDAAKADARAKNAEDELQKLRAGSDGSGKSDGHAELAALEKLQASFDAVRLGKFTPGDVWAVDKYGADSTMRGKAGAGNQHTLNDDLAQAKQTIANENKRIQELEAHTTELARQKADADTAAATAAKEGKHNADRVGELPGEIGDSRSKGNFEDAGGIIARGVSAEDAVQASGRATESQSAAIGQLNALAQASGTNMLAILRCLAISHQMHASQAQDIANIQRQFVELSSRHANSRNGSQG